jgi:hypothetical protein
MTAALVASGAGWAGDRRPLPYGLSVEVVAGQQAGPVSLREELARAVRDRLDAAGCFARIAGESGEGAAEPDLIAELTVSGYEEELRFDQTLATLQDRDAPGTESASETAEVSGIIDLRVLTPGTRSLVRGKRLARHVVHAAMLGDSRAEAVELWIGEVARATRSFLCAGSEGKWRTALERAKAPPR